MGYLNEKFTPLFNDLSLYLERKCASTANEFLNKPITLESLPLVSLQLAKICAILLDELINLEIEFEKEKQNVNELKGQIKSAGVSGDHKEFETAIVHEKVDNSSALVRLLTQDKSRSSLKKVSKNIFNKVLEYLKTDQLTNLYHSNNKKIQKIISNNFVPSDSLLIHHLHNLKVLCWYTSASNNYEHLKAIVISDAFGDLIKHLIVDYNSFIEIKDQKSFCWYAKKCKNLEKLQFIDGLESLKRRSFHESINDISKECKLLNEIIIEMNSFFHILNRIPYFESKVRNILDRCLQVSKITVTDTKGFTQSYER